MLGMACICGFPEPTEITTRLIVVDKQLKGYDWTSQQEVEAEPSPDACGNPRITTDSAPQRAERDCGAYDGEYDSHCHEPITGKEEPNRRDEGTDK